MRFFLVVQFFILTATSSVFAIPRCNYATEETVYVENENSDYARLVHEFVPGVGYCDRFGIQDSASACAAQAKDIGWDCYQMTDRYSEIITSYPHKRFVTKKSVCWGCGK